MAMATSVISIQSQVVHGHVGNSAAVLPMQVHGLNVAAVPTTLLSNHLGFETVRGRVLESELVADLLRGVEERGLIQTSRYIISGYLGSRANGDVVASFVQRARELNPDITYICDPVMGDAHLGVFVADQVVECIRDKLVPLADLLTPNQFEVGLITQSQPTNWAMLEKVVSNIQAIRGAALVVTSCNLADTAIGSLDNIVFEGTTRTRLASPRLPVTTAGTGDLYCGLLTANLVLGCPLVEAARRAAATVLEVLKRTLAERQHEMQLAGVVEVLAPRQANKSR